MSFFKDNVIKPKLWSLALPLSLLALPLAGGTAFAQDTSPATLQNSTSQTVDYYVILSDGSSQYEGSVAAGAKIQDEFFLNETILVTATGSDTVLKQFTFDGTPNSVLTVTNEVSAGPPNVTGRPSNVVSNPVEPPKVEERKVIISNAFKQWLKTDYVNHDPREPNKATYQDGFQDKFRVEGPMRKGYNILKMDPSDLTKRGLKGVPPNIIAPLKGTDFNWGIREMGLAMPNDLVILAEQAGTQGKETTVIMFSSEQERQSTSLNVGLSGGAKGTGAKGGKDAASSKVGISKTETKFESSGETLIRKQIVGQGYWLVYAKKDMRLGPQLEAFLSDKSNLKNYGDFKRFFERYGTHWPVATLFGGYIRYDEKVQTKEIANTIAKSLSVDASGTVPIKAAEVTPSVGFSQSNEESMREKERLGKAEFVSKGGTPGANYMNWQMATPTTADNYVPLKVELRGIHELMWPELMGVTDPKEANRIHALRVKTAQMLERYTEGIRVDNSDWDPRVYKATYNYVKVDKVDDEGNDVKMEFYGTGSIKASDGGRVEVTGVRHRGDNTPSRGKGYNLMSGSKKPVFLTKTARAVKTNVNGRQTTKPEFDTSGNFKFETRYREYDTYTDDEKAHGDIYISIKDVEAHPKKKLSKTDSYSEDGEGIRVKVTVERVNYKLENDSLELLALPGLDRLGQGDAIASRAVNVSGGGNAAGSGSNSAMTTDNRNATIVSGLGTCLAAVGTSNNANVVSTRCNANDSKQLWRIKGQSIIHSSGKCLNVRKTDQNITLWACNGDTNKKWARDGQSFKNVKFNMCLDVTASSKKDGANVIAYRCTNNKNQVWTR